MPKQSSSMKKTSLSAVEQYELNQWLEQNRISSTNLRRSFTDVLPLARLLSHYFPELIDLNHYPPRNSVQNKLCNWESFNKRVLTRLGLQLSREQMICVARSVPGSVDLLLYSVMRVQMEAERKAREERPSTEDEDEATPMLQDDLKAEPEPQAETETKHKIKPKELTLNVGVAETKDATTKSLKQAPLKRAATVTARGGVSGVGGAATPRAGRNKKQPLTAELNIRQRGEQLTELPKQRMVLYSTYMQAVNQLQRKNAKIERFDQWSAHLENMLQLKCERIDELQRQVDVAAMACRHKPMRLRHRRSGQKKRNLQLATKIGGMLEAAKRL